MNLSCSSILEKYRKYIFIKHRETGPNCTSTGLATTPVSCQIRNRRINAPADTKGKCSDGLSASHFPTLISGMLYTFILEEIQSRREFNISKTANNAHLVVDVSREIWAFSFCSSSLCSTQSVVAKAVPERLPPST